MIKLKTLLFEQTWTRLTKYLDDIIDAGKQASRNKKLAQAERDAAERLAKQKTDDVINQLSSTNTAEVILALKSTALYDDLADAIKQCAKNPSLNKPNNIVTNLLDFFKDHGLSDADAIASTKRILNTFAKEKGHKSWKAMSSQLSKGTTQANKLTQFKTQNPKLYKAGVRTVAAAGATGAAVGGYKTYNYVTDTRRKQENSENENLKVLATVTPGEYNLNKSLFENIKTCKIYNAAKNQTSIKPGSEKLEWSNAIFEQATLVMYGEGETKTNHGQIMFIPMIGTLTIGNRKFVCNNWSSSDNAGAKKSDGAVNIGSSIDDMSIYVDGELIYLGQVNDKLQAHGLGRVGRITDTWINGMCPAYGNLTPDEMFEKWKF